MEMMQFVLFFSIVLMWFVVFIFATEVQTLSCIYHFFILNLRRVLSQLGQFFY